MAIRPNASALRSEIEKALDEIISNEEGMRFQGLAVVLARQRRPELVASERKNDWGLDAHASATGSPDGIGKGLACSITAELSKIVDDATKVYGAETLSRRQFVLVDDTAETIAAQNTSITACRHRRSRPSWLRWRKRQRSMWPVPVVMVHEDNEDPVGCVNSIWVK